MENWNLLLFVFIVHAATGRQEPDDDDGGDDDKKRTRQRNANDEWDAGLPVQDKCVRGSAQFRVAISANLALHYYYYRHANADAEYGLR